MKDYKENFQTGESKKLNVLGNERTSQQSTGHI